MTCGEFQERFADYLSDSLEDEQKKVLDDHLAVCGECLGQFELMKSVWRELGELPDAEPSPSLRSGFYSMLAREKQRIEERPSFADRFEGLVSGLWPRRPALQFMMGLALLAVGLLVGSQIGFNGARNGDIASMQREITDLRQMVSVSLMNQASSTERLRGIQYSSQVDRPTSPLIDTLLNKLNTDPNVNIRLAAIEALYVFSDRPGVRDELIASLSSQKSPLVQVSLIDLLVEMREARSLGAMRELLQDQETDQHVKEYTETRMKELM
jgi:hypothetical protein